MKLYADIGGELVDVDLVRNGRECRAVVDGREYSLDVSQPEPGVYLIKDGNSIHETSVNTVADGSSDVRLHGREHQVTITDPKRLRGGDSAGGDATGKVEIRAAMPGKVVRVIVAQGDTVVKGESVIVVEAMKMQNEMKALKDGVVSEIMTSEGSTVGAGDTLIVIE
jgi:biotin carboxyl carrier protein